MKNKAWEEYRKIEQPAWEEYEEIRKSAQEEYQKKLEEINALPTTLKKCPTCGHKE